MKQLNLRNRLFRYGRFGFILFILSVPSMVYADMEDILSRFQFYGNVEEVYDSNVHLTPNNREHDFITNASLGLRFSTLPRSGITGEYQPPSTTAESRYGVYLDFLPGYVFYARGTSENYVSLSGNMDTWYTWDRKLTFRVKDYLIRSEEPLEKNFYSTALPGQVFLGNPIGRPIYLRNAVQPSIEYQFGREDVISVNYLNNVYENRSPAFENSMENYVNPKVTYWFNIRHGVSLEYALDLGEFQRSPNMTGNLGRGRYTYRFNPTTSVFGEYTFQSREFETPVSSSTQDYDIHAPAVGFEYAFSPTLTLTAKGGYFCQIVQGKTIETITKTFQRLNGETESGPLYDIVLKQRTEKTTYTLGFQGGYTEDYFTAQNLGFAKYNQVIGTITHQLMERLTVTVSGRYQRPKFNNGRLDNIWGGTTGASYRILKWLTLGLEFSYVGDHSNIETNDYTDFRGIFRVTATY
ncbi:MAG TPA: outer membrane beta-barrel protein [Thermodesulfobacteriota bacterium]|nr:outer membrane beta-barrel protein [Thermodesulfobacteriota bacterium]